MEFPIRFYCALGVSAAFRVILTKISKRSGNAVQWNGGIILALPTTGTLHTTWRYSVTY